MYAWTGEEVGAGEVGEGVAADVGVPGEEWTGEDDERPWAWVFEL